MPLRSCLAALDQLRTAFCRARIQGGHDGSATTFCLLDRGFFPVDVFLLVYGVMGSSCWVWNGPKEIEVMRTTY